MEKKIVRINRVYTKTGDKGQTSLAGGIRVSKNHPRVEAYGTIDELNSILGLVRFYNQQKESSKRRDKFESILHLIQQRLFDIGSELATPPQAKRGPKAPLTEENVEWLETIIDAMNEELKPLNSFVLPGGSQVTAFLHQARTVCRRAERQVLLIPEEEQVSGLILTYVNRLSDALFVFSRWVASTLNEKEFLWEPGMSENIDWDWRE